MLKLRISGAIPLLRLYAFTVWTGKTLPLPFIEYVYDAWYKHISATLSYSVTELPGYWLSWYKYYVGENSLSELCDIHYILGVVSTPALRQFIVTNQNDFITYYFEIGGNGCGLNPDTNATNVETAMNKNLPV
jgi:hypothetical protein